MKLSKRERFLIGLLLLVFIWVLAFRGLIAPSYSSLIYTRQIMDELKQKREEMDWYLEHYPDLDTQFKDGEEHETFFYQDIEDVFIDKKLQSMAENAGVKIRRMSIGAPRAMEISESEAQIVGEGILMAYVVTMEVDSPNVEGVVEFIDEMYRDKKSLEVGFVDMKRESDAGTTSGGKGSGMKGNVEVRFYYEKTR